MAANDLTPEERKALRHALHAEKGDGPVFEAVAKIKADAERMHAGKGWDRAHTMLCHDTYPKCQHRNPWMITRGTT
jgi:hypothetical protein